MIRAEVGKHRDIRGQRPGQIGLVGRQFQHHHFAVARRINIQHPAPDVARHLGWPVGDLQDVMDQRRGGGFAVRPGDSDHPRRLVETGPVFCGERGEEQADVIVDRDAEIQRPGDQAVRCRIKMRDTGAGDQGCHILQHSGFGQIGGVKPLFASTGARLGTVIPEQRNGSTCHQRPRGGDAGAPQPQHRDLATVIALHCDHRGLWVGAHGARRRKKGAACPLALRAHPRGYLRTENGRGFSQP